MTVRRIGRIICQEKWKKCGFWKNEVQNQVEIFWQTLMFWVGTFFQVLLENFQWTVWTCSRYLRAPLNIVICVSKKIRFIRRVEIKRLLEMYKKVENTMKWNNWMNIMNIDPYVPPYMDSASGAAALPSGHAARTRRARATPPQSARQLLKQLYSRPCS